MSAVFDAAHFAHMTGDDADLQREVLALFRAQAAEWRQAFDEAAPETLAAVVHTLKGSARGIGLWRLAEACADAEADPGKGLADVRAALDEALAALDAAGA